MDEHKSNFDLKKRTCLFGKSIIKLLKIVPKNVITLPLISQLVRSSTSIGANYREADCAESKADFIHKIGICSKEANETIHWPEMIMTAVPEMEKSITPHYKEAIELNLIFNSIRNSTRRNAEN